MVSCLRLAWVGLYRLILNAVLIEDPVECTGAQMTEEGAALPRSGERNFEKACCVIAVKISQHLEDLEASPG